MRARVQLRQSLQGLGALEEEVEELLGNCKALIRKMDQELQVQARELGWGVELTTQP